VIIVEVTDEREVALANEIGDGTAYNRTDIMDEAAPGRSGCAARGAAL
jgi:hypothetical protein